MKILVVQLLRMGDIVMSTPVFEGLSQKYPNSQIDILVNSECRHIVAHLPHITNAKLFDRRGLQDSIAYSDRSIFEAFSRLNSFFDELNAEQYDLVINLTHTRISGHICSRIASSEKIGLSIESSTVEFGGSWFQFLNEHGSGEREDSFHFSDIYYYGAQLPGKVKPIKVVGNAVDEERVNSHFSGIDSIVAVQPMTSDVKKNYGEANWVKFAKRFYSLNPHSKLVFLGSEAERNEVESIVNHLIADGISAFAFICSIGELISLLSRSDLLITGDTLTKHLATGVEIPVVEISLGSSDPRRTGPYSNDGIVLKSKEHCSPCVHSDKCFRTFHACAEGVSPSVLAMVAYYRLVEDWESIHQLASESRFDCEVYITSKGELPSWQIRKINEEFSELNIARYLNQVTWYLFLQCRDSGGLFEMGTETFKLQRSLEAAHPHIEPADWKYMYAQLNRIYHELEERIVVHLEDIRKRAPKYEEKSVLEEIKSSLRDLRREFSGFYFLESYMEAIDFVTEDSISRSFVAFRRMLMILSEVRDRLVIEGKIANSMISRIEEVYGREV